MRVLPSLCEKARIVVIGSSGGIGSEFVRQFATSDKFSQVFAISRKISPATHASVHPLHIDFADESSIAAAASQAARESNLDGVIVATGILHGASLNPEKRLRDLDPQDLMRVLHTNTLGPALVAKHFLPLLRKRGRSVFAALSARVGSIGDNRLGGWISYRTSKAALNMVLKTAAIEHRRSHPDSIVVGLHPGTVDTRLSAPFQKNVPEGKMFTPAEAVSRMLGVIENLEPADSGYVYAWDGQRIVF